MMTKIFGAALIVSGGFLLGKIRTLQWSKRLKKLKEITDLFDGYLGKLSEYRGSIEEYFNNQGDIGIALLSDCSIEGLNSEDLRRARECIHKIKIEGYQESLRLTRGYINEQRTLIKALEEEAGSSGKALPLVTGAIGFLVAVFLF